MSCNCKPPIKLQGQLFGSHIDHDLSIHFNHGCGDCSHFALLLQLYKKRGYNIKLKGEENKNFIWKVAGVNLINDNAPHVAWGYPDNFDNLSFPDWEKNKIAWNLNQMPLPHLGNKKDLWDELINIELDAGQFVSQNARDCACNFIEGLSPPIVLLHTHGNTWIERKDLSSDEIINLQLELLDRGYSIIILDWDNRTPCLTHERIRNIKNWCKVNLEELSALYEVSNLLIGIDSCPYHYARLNKIPTLGVWRSLHPVRCALPSPRTYNLVSANCYNHWHSREKLWNLLYYEDYEPTAKEIAKTAQNIIENNLIKDDCNISGSYLYHRVGYDQRILDLLEDHTIGTGAAGCELFWTVTNDKTLTILGNSPTMKLKKTDNNMWVGRWLHHEKMPIELTPIDDKEFPREKFIEKLFPKEKNETLSWVPRYETLFKIVYELKPLSIVEIGVRAGYSSWTMLEASPNAWLLGIDADIDPRLENSHLGFKDAWKHAAEINKDKKFAMMICDSHKITKIPECDLCYIDGDHTEEGCYADLILAEKSAKIILCDDYLVENLGCRKAIDIFMSTRTHLKGKLIDNGSTGLFLIK